MSNSDLISKAARPALTRNSERLVDHLVSQALKSSGEVACNDKHALATYLKSILLVIIAKRSDEPEWFSPQDYQRFQSSINTMASRIQVFLTDPLDGVQTYLKYHLNMMYFKAMADPTDMEPPCDNSKFKDFPLFSGYVRVYINHAVARCRHGDKSSMSFLYSLAKGSPKYWPAKSPSSLAASFKKHAKKMGTDHGLVESSDLKLSIISTSKLIIGNSPIVASTFQPSGGACTQCRVSDNGSLGLYRPPERLALGFGLLPSIDRTVEKQRQVNWLIACRHVLNRHSGQKCSEDPILINQLKQLDAEADFDYHIVYACETCAGPQSHFRNGKLRSTGLHDMISVGIAEPAKYRIIGVQDGHKSTANAPLSAYLLGKWKESSYGTMHTNDLTETVTEMVSRLASFPRLREKFGFTYYCSGDYSGATDSLKADATRLSLESLRGTHWFELAHLAFHPGTIHYPKVCREVPVIRDGKPVLKKDGKPLNKLEVIQPSFDSPYIDGQPMGNNLSFALLCIINLSIYFTTLKRWLDKDPTDPDRCELYLHLKKAVIVNGDDIAFSSSRELYDIFIQVANEAGFEISIGKQFLSPHFLQINSQVFRVNGYSVKRCHYLNLNLLSGNNIKSGDSGRYSTPTGIASELNLMLEDIPWAASCVPMALNRFKHLHKNRFTPNWSLPAHLGGYGLNPKFVSDPTPSRDQRLIAARFLQDPSLALYRRALDSRKQSIEFHGRSIEKKIEALSETKVIVSARDAQLPHPQKYDDLREDDPISQRVQTFKRICYPIPIHEDDKMIPDFRYLKKTSENSWIKPLSLEKIEEYRDYVVRYHNKGEVRQLLPINTLSLPRFWANPNFNYSGHSLEGLPDLFSEFQYPNLTIPQLDNPYHDPFTVSQLKQKVRALGISESMRKVVSGLVCHYIEQIETVARTKCKAYWDDFASKHPKHRFPEFYNEDGKLYLAKLDMEHHWRRWIVDPKADFRLLIGPY